MMRGVEDALSFVAGMTLGGTLTYLLDPDLGKRRRRKVVRTTTGVLHNATESSQAAVGRATGAAVDAAYRAGHTAGRTVGAAQSSARHYGKAATRLGLSAEHRGARAIGSTLGSVGSAFGSAVKTGEDWLDSAYGVLSGTAESAGRTARRATVHATRKVGRQVGQAGKAVAVGTAATGGLFGSLSALFGSSDNTPRRRSAPPRSKFHALTRRPAPVIDDPWYAPWLAATSTAPDGRQRLVDRGQGSGRPAPSRNVRSADHDASEDGGFGRFMIGLGLVGVGSGLAYLLDTGRGRSGRDQLVARARSAARDAAGSAVHLSNRAKGVAAEAVASVRAASGSADAVNDDALEATARAEAGHVVEDVDALGLTVDDGRITLSGRAPNGQITALVERLEGLPGVRSVENGLRAS